MTRSGESEAFLGFPTTIVQFSSGIHSSPILSLSLSLPKISYSLHTCPHSYLDRAFELFDQAIRDALEDLVGAPLPDWAWPKASLPVKRRGLNISCAALHGPAAYLGSLEQSRPLVERILGYSSGPPSHLYDSIVALAAAADHPNWLSLEDINIPLCQSSISSSINEVSQRHLLF